MYIRLTASIWLKAGAGAELRPYIRLTASVWLKAQQGRGGYKCPEETDQLCIIINQVVNNKLYIFH